MAAGLASFPFKPTGAPTLSPASNSAKPLFYSSFSPLPLKKRGLRSCQLVGTVVARYGGGGYRPRPSGGNRNRRGQRDNRVAESDYDAALDLDRLKSNSARLLDTQQNMIGVVSIAEAIRMAEDDELILAIMSVDADPPVLRLFEIEEYNSDSRENLESFVAFPSATWYHRLYDPRENIEFRSLLCSQTSPASTFDDRKHKYEQLKKKRDQQKRSSANRQDMKELKMGYNIDSHDYSVRLRAAQKFLKDGDKVKVMVNLKGRENEFRNIAIELLKRFQNDIGELGAEESKNFNDRNVYIILMPNKAVIQKSQERTKKKAAPGVEISI